MPGHSMRLQEGGFRRGERQRQGDRDGKIRLLMEYTDRPGDVADPWYTGDFETTWRDVLAGCSGLRRLPPF